MQIKIKKILPVLIVILSFLSVSPWSKIPLGNTFVTWTISILIIITVLRYKKQQVNLLNRNTILTIRFYLIWALIGIIRGLFLAENYWEWKQLVSGSIAIILPIFVYVFSVPNILGRVIKYWKKYAFPLFFLFFMWNITTDSYHHYLSPLYLFMILLPILNRKWQIISILLILLMIVIDLDARSQTIKAMFVILIPLLYIPKRPISLKIIKIGHWTFYILTITLLYLGLTNSFNVFEFMSGNSGKYTVEATREGETVTEDLAVDTRTFIYVEVITSAIKHNYVLFGRTPARGNDSQWFGDHLGRELRTGKYERHRNEVCFPNIFTWLGLVGMILYCLIYLQSSYLAVYRSNNIYMKLIGLFIAFRFLYGWIEDTNELNLLSLTIWIMISMGLSKSFRSMSDLQFKIWAQSILT